MSLHPVVLGLDGTEDVAALGAQNVDEEPGRGVEIGHGGSWTVTTAQTRQSTSRHLTPS
ncbi:hypothetical protein OG819_51755 [Streptomyces sp. NBC_01549]|uniref:hypothetical protein n=1 Tax=unclassified Streptomyces TaxID=2593676 RepID=UPI00225185E8|nr:hypothetical protein [Streptomyces sp. NBC_01549]MCX4597726.1 hypothetical protein [Streptomyces sp. NBC_01549]